MVLSTQFAAAPVRRRGMIYNPRNGKRRSAASATLYCCNRLCGSRTRKARAMIS
jgi:hypothetical protein